MTEENAATGNQSRWRWNSPPALLPAQISPREIIRSRSFVIAALSYLAVLLLMFWPLFKGGVLHSGAQTSLVPPFSSVNPNAMDAIPYVNGWEGDFTEQFAWFEDYQYRSAREGRFPSWNPHIYLGAPFHADGQSAMLFPFHWIYFFADPNLMRGPMTILRLWTSAMALFCLLRKFELAPVAAFVGGAVWALSSFNIHWLLWPQSNASLWLPVVLLAIDYLLIKPGWRGYAVASIAIAPLFLGGHPGTIYLCGNVIVIYAIIRLVGLLFVGLNIRQVVTAVGAVVAAGFTGLLLASAALLPLLIQILHSFEYLDVGGHRGAVEDLPWNTLWLFLMPEYFGRPRGGFPNFGYNGPINYIETTLWFGAFGFVLAMASVAGAFVVRIGYPIDRWRKQFSFPVVFGITVMVLSLLIVFCIPPVYKIATSMPGMGLTSLRRFLFATHLAGAVLAACALDQILAKKDRTTATLASLFALTGCALAVTCLWMRWDGLKYEWGKSLVAASSQLGPNWPRFSYSMIEQYGGFRMIAGTALLLIGTVPLLCIMVLTWRRRPISPSLRYLFAAVVVLDVMLPGYDFTPIAPLSLAVPAMPEVLQSMILQTGEGRMLGVDWLLDPNMSMHYGFRDIRGYDLPHNYRLAQLYKRMDLDKLDNRALMTLDRFYPYIKRELEAYLNRTCVRTLLVYHPDPNAVRVLDSLKLLHAQQSPGYMNWPQSQTPGNGLMVFTNPNAYPRTFFAKSADATTNQDDAMDVLLDASSDLRDRSVYEGAKSPHSLVSASDEPDTTASITMDKPEQLVIDARASAEHLLVLEDRMDDGWTVNIDGKPAEALTANYLFRGVIVPAGHHIVEWDYHAPGLLAGVTISIATFLGMIGLIIAVTFAAKGRVLNSPPQFSNPPLAPGSAGVDPGGAGG